MKDWIEHASLPQAPDYRPLQKSDAPLLREIFANYPPLSSEFTFTNLWAWSKTHPVDITRAGETIFFVRGPQGRRALIGPIGPVDEQVVKKGLDFALSAGAPPVFQRADDAIAERLVEAAPDLIVTSDRNNADYVYRVDILSALPGRHLDGKRNLVRKFEKDAQFEYRPITTELIGACADAQAFWCDEKECAIHADLEAENAAVLQILEHWEMLNLFGGALVAPDGEVLAFSMAEALAPGVAVTHLEKGNTKFKGVYQAINQYFAENGLQDFQLVNREQDLGVEGLRKAKLSYQPDHLVMKYSLSFDS